MDVLIKFRHGLGDTVQLTTVLGHLKHYHPDWRVDVQTLTGKHSALAGLCRRSTAFGHTPNCEIKYDRVFNLDWHECHKCFSDWPSTKAERCLIEVFGLRPIPEKCRYTLGIDRTALQLARRYLESLCKVMPAADGRYPVVLIHYQGNTSAELKDLPHRMVHRLCDDVIESGAVPVILDWDCRSPLPDGRRIHCPHARAELWGGLGTGDAAVLAALTSLSSLMIGIDSGPLHVAGATSTPTLGVWTAHHPLHYFAHADNVTHLVPENHLKLLRGDRLAGGAYFAAGYRHRTYDNLQNELCAALRDQLKRNDGGLVHTRNFWIRANHARQDLVIVKDIAEDDSYRVDRLPMPRPVVVDVGAHIGVFSTTIHRRNPLSRIIAVECCPENVAALRKNIGNFATVIQATVSYGQNEARLTSVHPKTVTLENIVDQCRLDRIDVLKLDCEGDEFSILDNTTLLDRISMIVGEYHGKEAFVRLVAERFGNWRLEIIRDGDKGTFWLTSNSVTTARRPARVDSSRR